MKDPPLTVGRFRLFERRGRRYRCRLCSVRLVAREAAVKHRDREVARYGEENVVLRLRWLASRRRALMRRDYARWLHENRMDEGAEA